MRLIVSPYVSVGPIKLGMTRDEVRNALGSSPVEFQKSFSLSCNADDFEDWHLHVFYRDNYVCNAVEMHAGSHPMLHGRDLMSTKYSALLAEFRGLDQELEIDASSFISRKFGVSVYSPPGSSQPEGVVVFERGYYD